MSRAALLLVVGEAFNDTQKTLILDRITGELQSWDDDGSRCDLQKELEDFVALKRSCGDDAISGAALSHSSDNLSITILFGPDRKLLHDSLQNFLLLDSHYRHLVYAGQTVAGSGSWILPDDVFTFRDFVKVLKEMDSVGVGGDGKGFALNVSSTSDWDWSQNNFSRLSNLGVRLAAAGSLSEKGQNFDSFRAFLDPFVTVVDVKDLLKTSSTVGMINFSGPTLYIFPGGNGSSSLFGVKGFTGLIDGGYSRKSCFWDFSRHLHQIDMVILSHLGVSNFLGMQSFLERKAESGSPDVGSVFFNCPERFRKLPASSDSLKVNLFNAGAALSEKLNAIGLPPQPCFVPQPFQPITIYNKVGFGSVDMYVLNPVQNSEEMKNFLHQWSMRAESELFSAHSGVPLSSALSVSILLVWKPFSPSAKIVRILFPGGTPQAKIFEGLDRLKNVPVFERSECSQTELNAKPTKVAQSRPTTLKPTPVKVNGNLDHKESPKAKALNGSKDPVVGKARVDAKETIQAKTSATQRATKVEPKKTEKADTSHANGTPTPKADVKATSKPVSPSKSTKDAKTASSKNTENLPPNRPAQKPSEAETSPKNKPTKASQPEAAKQSKPPRRTEELKPFETVKQAPASRPLLITKVPAAKHMNSAKEPKATKHTEPVKQTKASSVAETAKHSTPKPIKASKESDKKAGKQAEPKKQKQPDLEKKDLEKAVKEEVPSLQPMEEVKQSKTPENVVSEPVCVVPTAVQQTSALPPEVGLVVAQGVLSDGDAAIRAADYDLPSPEDVAQMSQEDEDSFVEELPTEMEPGYDDQKDKDSGIAATTADPDLILDHEMRDEDSMAQDSNIHEVNNFYHNDEANNENEIGEAIDFACSREIRENHEIGDCAADTSVANQEIVEDKIDAELQEVLQFERDEEAVQNLDESGHDAYVEEDVESVQLSHMRDPDVIPTHDISGVSELATDENMEGVDDSEEKVDHEDSISHDHKDLLDHDAAADQDSLQDQDGVEEREIAEGLDEDRDLHKDHGLEKEDLEKDRQLEKEDMEKEDMEKDHDFEEYELEKECDLHKDLELEKEPDLEKDHDLETEDVEKDHDFEEYELEKECDLRKDHVLEKEDLEEEDVAKDRELENEPDLEKDHDLETEDVGKDRELEEHDESEKDRDLQKDGVEKDQVQHSWLLQSSHSALQHGAFQVKKATDGLARYCEEFGSDEGEVAEDEDEEHTGREVNEDDAACLGGIQVPVKKADAEEEDEVDELEAVLEEEEMDEDEGARTAAQECRKVPKIGPEEDVVLAEDAVSMGVDGISQVPTRVGNLASGRFLPDVLGDEDHIKKREDLELFGSAEAEIIEHPSSPVPDFQVDTNDEVIHDEDFGKYEDFARVGDYHKGKKDFGKGDEDFGKGGEDFGKGEEEFGKYEDFGKAEQDFGKCENFGKVQEDFGMVEQDLGKVEEDFVKDEQIMTDEDPGSVEEMNRPEDEVKDDGASDVELSEKEGPIAGEGSGGSLSDNEAEELEPDAGKPLELMDDMLPCALKKDTAIENLAAICAEAKDGPSENAVSVSSSRLLVGDSRPDVVAACEVFEPHDMTGTVETDEGHVATMRIPDVEEAEETGGHAFGFDMEEPENCSMDEAILQSQPRDRHSFDSADEDQEASMRIPDVEEAEETGGHAFGFDTEEPQICPMDEAILQSQPHDRHSFDPADEDEPPSSNSWKLENMAADLAQEVIKSSLATQNLEGSACFASGPESVAGLNDAEKRELEAHESTPEKLDIKNLLNTMVDAVATDDSTSSGRFNYGFDDDRKEEALGAFAADSFGGACSADVQPAQYREKLGEDSGESDLDDGQDACHHGQRGLEGENEQEDVSRLDEGFEESNGDEAPANVTELLHHRAETKSPAEVEDGEGPSASAFGASGEVTDEQEEAFDSAGGPEPASEKNVDDHSPLVEFDSDVSATHQMEFGNGCVEAQQNLMDAWEKNNLNPFMDPFSAEAEFGDENENAELTKKKENVGGEFNADGKTWMSSDAGYYQSMAASGIDPEEFDRRLESDEQSIPSDDSALPVMPHDHDQDMTEKQSTDEQGSDKLKETPEDESAEMSAQLEEDLLEPNVVKSHVDEDSSVNSKTSSFWAYDNAQSTEPATSHSAADNILFSEETTDDVERDINENLGVATGLDEEDGELEEDLERVSTQSNDSEEGESRSSAVVSEPHEGPESLDSDVEADPVKSWGHPMGLPAPAQDSNRAKPKTTSRPNHDAANITLPASLHDKKSPAKNNDRSFVAPQKKANDVRRSGVLRSAVDPNESKENGSVIKDAKTTTTKKPVASAAPVAKKPITTATDTTSKAKPLKHVVPFYVDLTYIPGNGDPAYVDTDFFRRVRARYYVLSSLEPDPRVLSCLVEGKQTWDNKDLSVNVIPTHDSAALHRWFHENAKLMEELKISLLPAANKCTIKLQDKDDGCYAFRIEF